MQSLPFASLSKSQRADVAYLFADHIFGTDASAFVYEVKDGKVSGRALVKGQTSKVVRRAQQIPSVKVTMVQEVNLTDELFHHASMNMDALAALIANRIHQSKLEEVHA